MAASRPPTSGGRFNLSVAWRRPIPPRLHSNLPCDGMPPPLAETVACPLCPGISPLTRASDRRARAVEGGELRRGSARTPGQNQPVHAIVSIRAPPSRL